MFFLEASDERSFWDISHHNGSVAGTERGLAVVRLMSAIALAARAFVSWTVVTDVSKEMTYSTRIVVIFGVRAMRRVEVLLFFVPESPFQFVLIIEKSSLLLRESVEVSFSLWLGGGGCRVLW